MYIQKSKYDFDVFVDPEDYRNEKLQKFVEDCQDEGFDVEHYHGRFYWQGPAVRCDHSSQVTAITSIPCQHDSMALGVIVYPCVSGGLTEDAMAKREQLIQEIHEELEALENNDYVK